MHFPENPQIPATKAQDSKFKCASSLSSPKICIPKTHLTPSSPKKQTRAGFLSHSYLSTAPPMSLQPSAGATTTTSTTTSSSYNYQQQQKRRGARIHPHRSSTGVAVAAARCRAREFARSAALSGGVGAAYLRSAHRRAPPVPVMTPRRADLAARRWRVAASRC